MENTLLNLVPASYLPEVHLSQYDIGRTITFTLKDGSSDYSVPSGASVKVKATKPSGLGFEVACTFNGGTVTLVTTETMTPENGRFPAELSIVSGNTVIGTSNFIFNIERSPHPEGTIDGDAESLLPELTLLVERIEAAAEDVDEKAELFLNLSAEAETLPAGSLATANYSDGVLTLGIPRGYDGDDTKADAIVKSASGEIASFTDGGNGLLVKSLNVNIVPKQSGSGDPSPSNVRPISGYEGVNVTRCGKNLCNLVYGNRVPSISSGQMVSASGWSTEFIKIDTSKDYVLSLSGDISRYVFFYDKNQAYISGLADFANRYRLNNYSSWANVGYVKLRTDEVASASPQIQLELGSTATTYEPYQGTSYPISLGQTVYGGTLDVVSGKLTLTKGYADLGSLNWSYDGTRFYTRDIASLTKGYAYNVVADAISSIYKADIYSSIASQSVNNIFVIGETGTLSIKNTAYADASAFKTAMNGVQLVYELATPIEVTLTPTQVTTLLGNNNIFADSGSVEVEYRADTTLAYNELVAMILENIGN